MDGHSLKPSSGIKTFFCQNSPGFGVEVHQEIHPSSLRDRTPYPTNHPYLHCPRQTKQQDHQPRIHTKNHRYRPDPQVVVPEFQSGQLSPQSHLPCQKLIPKYSMNQLDHQTHSDGCSSNKT